MGYTKQVYDRAWMALERRRQEFREKNRIRREEIHQGVPQIREIEREMAATAASVAKAVLAEPNRAAELVEELAARNLALQARRGELLVANGYPADYLKEQFGCGLCGDKGYVEGKRCDCLRELLRREAYRQLSQASQAEGCSFGNFTLSVYPTQPDNTGAVPRERMEEVYQACMRYAEGFGPEADSLLFLGHTGLGKTHLSLAIASTVTEAGYGVVYTPVQRLMDRLESEKFSRQEENREQYRDNTRHVLECDLLVLDDLGTEFATSFTTSVLYNIINTRMVEGRPTIISTNLDLAGIEERYSQRMVSRMVCGYRVMKFYGKDVRYLKKMRSMREKGE